MALIICADDRGGMAFNRRRQSQDRIVREHILADAAGGQLWMSPYSARQFGPDQQLIHSLAVMGLPESLFRSPEVEEEFETAADHARPRLRRLPVGVAHLDGEVERPGVTGKLYFAGEFLRPAPEVVLLQ